MTAVAPASPGPLLAVNNIEVVYDHVILVLKGVSLAVPNGGIVALLGANGAGKTTTLKAISNLLGAERGEPSLGWMVGWAEKGEAHTVFALNMDCREQRHIDARMTLTQACLADIGAI